MAKLIARNEITLQEKHFNAVILKGGGCRGAAFEIRFGSQQMRRVLPKHIHVI